MGDQLAMFEGLPLDSVTAKLKGTLHISGAGRLAIGDIVNVVLEGTVVGVLHEDKDGLLVRTHLIRPETAKLS